MISFPHWHLSSVLFYITCIFPVIWAYPKCESTFPFKSQSECPSVCPVLFRFQHSWDQEEPNSIPAQQVYSPDDHGQDLYLRTNQIKQICGLITYMKHIFGSYNSGIAPQDDPFQQFSPVEWTQQTPTQMRSYLIQYLPDPHAVPYGPISSTRLTGYSTAAIELMAFKKGIDRRIAAYPSLRDERYFGGFKRSLFIVAKSHECNEDLHPTFTPGCESEQQELFEVKQTFMYSVFNVNVQTDMGKTIVRRHLTTTGAQSVW